MEISFLMQMEMSNAADAHAELARCIYVSQKRVKRALYPAAFMCGFLHGCTGNVVV